MIIDVLNGTFFLLLFVFVAFLIGFWALFKNKSESTKRIAVAVLYLGAFVFFWIYKYWISLDEAYSVITADNGEGAFSWWRELPLQLCNINLILIPIASLTRSKSLTAFAVFMAPFGAILAMVMPSAGFAGYSLFIPRVFGFWVTHMFVLIGSPMLIMFGFFKPRFRYLPQTLIAALVITTLVFGFNMLLRVTHTFNEANYFYCVDPLNGTPLVWFWKIIPVPFLYMLPIFPVLALYMALFSLPFELIEKKKSAMFELKEHKAV